MVVGINTKFKSSKTGHCERNKLKLSVLSILSILSIGIFEDCQNVQRNELTRRKRLICRPDPTFIYISELMAEKSFLNHSAGERKFP